MASRENIYLSAADVKALAHYGHVIPITRGDARDYVHRSYPGWEWKKLLPVLLKTGRYDPATRTLREGLVGVVLTAKGEILDVDESLVTD